MPHHKQKSLSGGLFSILNGFKVAQKLVRHMTDHDLKAPALKAP